MRHAGITDRGYSVFELMTVVAVVAILIAVAIALYMGLGDDATDAVLRQNARALVTQITVIDSTDNYSWTYERSADNPNDYNPNSTLSRAIEEDLESGRPPGNAQHYKNPFSGSGTIVNWGSVLTSAPYSRPAVFITNNRRYSSAAANAHLAGSVVANFNASSRRIEVYFHDKNGVKSTVVHYLPYP